jgi:uncharacterized protein (TIGR02246 family)
MRSHTRTLLLFPLALLAACSQPEAKMEEVPAGASAFTDASAAAATARTAIDQANTAAVQAWNQGDPAKFAQVYSEDATIYPPDMEPIQGRQAIQEFWKAGGEQMGIKNLKLTTRELEVAGDWAYEQGTGEFDTNGGQVNVKYVVIWKKQADGSWKWHRDIWNMSPAPKS